MNRSTIHRSTPLPRMASVAVLLVASVMVAVAPASGANGQSRATDPPLTVTPSTGLVDNQSVTVSGSASSADLSLCPTASSGLDACIPLGDMARSTTIPIPARFMSQPFDAAPSLVDCRTTSCSLRTGYWDSATTSTTVLGEQRLEFDPSAPLRAAPTLTVDPSTGLVDGQQVGVTLTVVGGMGAPILACTSPVSLPADVATIDDKCDVMRANYLDGTTTGTVTVSPFVETANGPVDCRTAAASCVITTFDEVYQSANTPIGFDATAPVKPALLQRPLPLTEEPQPGIFVSTYDLVGFTPNDPYTVKWCNDAGDCLPPTIASGTLDASGMATFTDSGESFPAPSEDDHTCSDDGCTMTASDTHGLTAVGGPSIVTDYGPEVPTGPFESDRLPVTVTPRTNLSDGAQVTVTASGFTPGSNVAIVQCDGTALTEGADACDLDTSTAITGTPVTVDSTGAVHADFTVHGTIDVGGKSVDCTHSNVDPDAWAAGIAQDPSRYTSLTGHGYSTCIIAVADMANYRHSGGAPIAFTGATFKPLPWETSPPTTTPTTAAPTMPPAPRTGPVAATPVSAQPRYTG